MRGIFLGMRGLVRSYVTFAIPVGWRLNGPESHIWTLRRREKYLPMARIESGFPRRLFRSLVVVLNEISWLPLAVYMPSFKGKKCVFFCLKFPLINFHSKENTNILKFLKITIEDWF
jgi:hypothetical protein